MTAKTRGQDSSTRLHDEHMNNLAKKDISREITSSMPSKMYFLPEIYELERRAIFSKYWFLLSHQSRFVKKGDFVQYEMAGFNFVVVRNKEEKITGFHNICRHRAFPVVRQTSGNARIFACKYHGWSYNLDGKLSKGPRFNSESVNDFDPSDHSLFLIHIHVDRNGFVYANLDAKKIPDVSWQSQYGSLDRQEVLASDGLDWSLTEYDLTWTEEGKFNWKLMQDNFNECYHCLTAHQDVAKTTELDTYYVVPGSEDNFISHFSEPKLSAISQFDETRFTGRSATHVFPVAHFSPNPGTGFMHLMRTIPTGPTTTRQEYDVFKLNTPDATPEAHERMLSFYQNVIREDIELCDLAQKNLTRGVFVSGPLHPFHEEGVLAFQRMVSEKLVRHLDAEKEAGRKIFPAEPHYEDKHKINEQHGKILACELTKGLDW